MSVHPGSIDNGRATPAPREALLPAFGGIYLFAEKARDQLPGNPVSEDPDADMVSAAMLARCIGGTTRWAGLRDEVTACHPVALAMRIKLNARLDLVPEPDRVIVDLLRQQPGFATTDRIVTIDGVPIPAGEAQTAYFVVLRYRPLFSPSADPSRIYKGDIGYDARHVTDELQASVLLVDTAKHRDNLVALQRGATALYVAIWLRRVEVIDALVAATPTAALPPPYARSRHTNRRICLLIASDLFMEWERVFDLQGAIQVVPGVTRASVKAALLGTSTMSGVHAIDSEAGRHIAGAVAHARAVHPTMNDVAVDGDDPVFAGIAGAFANSSVYRTGRGPIVWVAGAAPVQFFTGLEPTRLTPVALVQMHETIVSHEGEFWTGKRGAGINDIGPMATRLMSLAVIVTSNIDLATARAMAADNGRSPPWWWLKNRLAPLVRNPSLDRDLATAAKRRDDSKGIADPTSTRDTVTRDAPGDRDQFKNAYAKARVLAAKCSATVGEPGWTQGFRQDAWRQPLAEAAFLRDCTRYVKFKQQLVPQEQYWRALLDKHGRAGQGVEALATIRTGLPRQHLVERVHDLHRDLFDRIQVAEFVHGHESTEAYILREALVRVAAPMLAALSPITDDPHLWERFRVNLGSDEVKIAVHGAWNVYAD